MRVLVLVFSMALLASGVCSADENLPIAGFESCRPQIEMYCRDVEPNQGALIKCLMLNQKDVSLQCKQDLARVMRTREQGSERGGGALSALGGFNYMASPFRIFSYEGRLPDGSQTNRELAENRVSLSIPVVQSPENTVSTSIAAAQLRLGKSVDLGTGVTVPQDLYRGEVGAQYTHQLGNYRSWGLRGSIGYAGDKSIDKSRDAVFSLNAQYAYPDSGGHAWIWTVFISNNSPFGNYVPLVGLLYFHKTEKFTGIFGFPILSLQWTPTPRTAYSASLFGTSATLESAFGEIREGQYFSQLAWANQNFILSDRLEEKDRLTIEEKKLSIGARSFFFNFVKAEVQLGYAFDRLYYVGTSVRNMRGGSQSVADTWFATTTLKAAF